MVGHAVEAAFFFASLGHGTAAAMTLPLFKYPFFVTLASWAIGLGRPSGLTVSSLVSAAAGAALIIGTADEIAAEAAGVSLSLQPPSPTLAT